MRWKADEMRCTWEEYDREHRYEETMYWSSGGGILFNE
jgi:hypothetical protein